MPFDESLIVTIIKEGRKCRRCGHEWIPKFDSEPKVCPKCKSPYWNRERKSKKTEPILPEPIFPKVTITKDGG